MKTAYELAMERLNKSAPAAKLTAGQRKALAELDSVYTAKIAAREIAMKSEIETASGDGRFEQAAELQQQLQNERQALQAELAERKESVRQAR
ncbi:MAG: hypothetical protein EPO07_01970 [Verrucomicrobia bacterium]|nr:MAG: hypothetical protein EPO07_01970 [Verrucomicrobiota bacterium]